jgi:hypothetical protein
MPTPPGQSIFRITIALNDSSPPIWRRLLVPGSIRLAKLHDIFQAAMGWTNSHLHMFTIGEVSYGSQFDDYPEDEIDEKSVTVLRALTDVKQFTYEYDFGDSWDHTVVVEEKTTTRTGLKFAVCLDGSGACPPEDCGGTGGYERLLEALGNPSDPEHEALMEWAGGPIDVAAFDLARTNAELQRLR